MRLVARGFGPGEAGAAAHAHRQLGDWIRTGQDSAAVAALLRDVATAPWRRHTAIPASLPTTEDLQGWYWGGRAADPLVWWRDVRVPVLLVFGAQDELVPPARSAIRIAQVLHDAGHADVTVRMFPGANHVLKVTRPASPAQGRTWDWPRQAPGYIEAVVAWAVRQTEHAAR
jgi:pimeloyl-ACP methyl ester carboxylesterase